MDLEWLHAGNKAAARHSHKLIIVGTPSAKSIVSKTRFFMAMVASSGRTSKNSQSTSMNPSCSKCGSDKIIPLATMADPGQCSDSLRSAGFQTCCIADFQSAAPGPLSTACQLEVGDTVPRSREKRAFVCPAGAEPLGRKVPDGEMTADRSPVRAPLHGPFACFVLLKGQ